MFYDSEPLDLPTAIGLDPITERFLDGCKLNDRFDKTRPLRRNEVLDLMKHQLVLESNIKKLRDTTDPDILAAFQTTATAFRTMIEGTFGNDPAVTAPTTTSASAANTVFELPELFDAIDLNLGTKDIFRAAQVNNTFANNISSSSAIQKAMLLQSDPSAPWRTPVDWRLTVNRPFHPGHDESGNGLPGFYCELEGEQNPPEWFWEETSGDRSEVDDSKWRLTVTLHDTSPTMPPAFSHKVGERGRRMLICDPPVYEMTVRADCCWSHHHSGTEALKSQSGITVGDIIDRAVSLREERSTCPYAAWHKHDPDTGLVRTSIRFKATLSLEKHRRPRVPDPEPHRPFDENPVYDEKEECLQAFARAKSYAAINGEAIPEFKQFWAQWQANRDEEWEV